MSGVYIRGMEMPKNCQDCPFFVKSNSPKYPFVDCKIIGRLGDVFNAISGIPIDCPLIPVPDHGRLIDADALWKEEKSADALHKLRPKGESVMYDAGFLAGYRAAAQIASNMPTIIPASKESD